MYVVRIDDASCFGDPQWDTLLSNSSQANVFLTRAWLETCWRHQAGQEAYILAVRDHAEQLVGAAPLVLRKNRLVGLRELSFMGTGDAAPDHLDFISVPQREPEITAAICQYLRTHWRDWDVLRLTDLRQDSLTASIVPQHFRGPFVCSEIEGATCPYLPLSGSWRTYLEQQSGNFRQQTRSKRRKFEQQPNARFAICRTPREVSHCLRCLFQFNPPRWAAHGTTSAFADRAFQEFHLDVATRFLSLGWLDLCWLQIEDQTVAVLYSFVFGDKVYYYNAGFDPRWSNLSLGRVLMAYHVQSVFDRGLAEYDFLRGSHSYKYAWTSLARCNRDVTVWQRSPKTLAYDRIQRGLRLARRTMKRHLPDEVRHRLKHLLSC